jgi:hypothetical protein
VSFTDIAGLNAAAVGYVLYLGVALSISECAALPACRKVFIDATNAASSAVNQAGQGLQSIIDSCMGGGTDSCPPCKTVSGKTVPVGTVAYRPLDVIPEGTIEHGVKGPHHNLFVANQAPLSSPKPCKCFWQKIHAVSPADLPDDAIPIEQFSE